MQKLVIVREKVILCFPEKIRRTLISSLKAQKPTIKEAKAKQKQIVVEMQNMAKNDRVDLRKIQEAWNKKGGAKKAPVKKAPVKKAS